MQRKKSPSAETLIANLNSPTPEIKYAASKSLRLLAEQSPASLYPHFDIFVRLLDHESSFLRWDATRTLAHLARADHAGKIEVILDKFLSPIDGPQMIGGATAIAGAAEIALAKPHLASKLVKAILRVRKAKYQTEGCRNIAIGHAIIALSRIMPRLNEDDRKTVLAFVRAQHDSPRHATRNKAGAFLERWVNRSPASAASPPAKRPSSPGT